MRSENRRHAVAIVGGAAAGAEAAGILSERGVVCVVFEQNSRPYGKIEDGLPRWHVRLRRKEYDTINQRLSRDNVHFVPETKIGRDIAFPALAREWGFTAVLLANGAWRDRPLPVKGADAYIGRGLVYQNSFIHWFNHCEERGYTGPRYEVPDGTIVVGGGLASIDVSKVVQIETVRAALAARGIAVEMLHVEHDGIPAVLAAHGLTWESLGLRGATLFYRRRVEDMPLADAPRGADAARLQKLEATRRKILEKAMQKYCFQVRPLMVPDSLVVEADRLVGLRFQHTRIEGGRAVPVAGQVEDVRAPLAISSIGSIPEPMPGIPQDGALYRYADRELGRPEGYDNVFSSGNVITGKGNILDSRKHSMEITAQLIERFLGLDDTDHRGEEELLDTVMEAPREMAGKMAEWVDRRPGIEPAQVERILERVRARQAAVGYDCPFLDWIARVSPPDLC